MKKIYNSRPFFPKEDIDILRDEFAKILDTGVLAFGPYIEQFEKEFADYIGVEEAVAVSTGTSALEIALRYHNLENKEVIVPTNSFPASANSVIFAGGTPKLVDINKDTLCTDLTQIKSKVSSKTAGVMLVHVAGMMIPDLKEIVDFCHENNLFLIEDSANAHGSILDNKKAGSFGTAGCFSFYATKTLATGEGGMITTNNSELANYARIIRNHGKEGQLHSHLGNNWRINEINALLGIFQLSRLEDFVQERNRIAQKYYARLKDSEYLSTIFVPKNIRHSYWKYPVIFNFSPPENFREMFMEKYQIPLSKIWYPPIHLQPFYSKNFGYSVGDLPVSEKILAREFCLPMYVGIDDEQINYIVEMLMKEFEAIGKDY